MNHIAQKSGIGKKMPEIVVEVKSKLFTSIVPNLTRVTVPYCAKAMLFESKFCRTSLCNIVGKSYLND